MSGKIEEVELHSVLTAGKQNEDNLLMKEQAETSPTSLSLLAMPRQCFPT